MYCMCLPSGVKLPVGIRTCVMMSFVPFRPIRYSSGVRYGNSSFVPQVVLMSYLEVTEDSEFK